MIRQPSLHALALACFALPCACACHTAFPTTLTHPLTCSCAAPTPSNLLSTLDAPPCALHPQVYTSSASVVFMGRPLVLVDEDTPYAAKPMDYYTKTKVGGTGGPGRGTEGVQMMRLKGIGEWWAFGCGGALGSGGAWGRSLLR